MSVPWYLMAKGKGGGGYKTVSGPIVTFRGNGEPLRSLVANIEPVQAGSGDPSPDNVRPISGWSEVNVWLKPTYDPTENPTATIQLGQTVYGGTLDVTNGVLTVDRAMASGQVQSLSFNTYNNIAYGRMTKPSGSKLRGTILVYDTISSMYAFDTATSGWDDADKIGKAFVGADYNWIWFGFPVGTTLEEMKSITENNVICYELATPITIPLTATEISTLQGQNNLWADTGDVTVEYLASGGANADLMKLAVAFMGRK